MIQFRWFMWQLVWRFKIMSRRDASLRDLLKDKQLIIRIQVQSCIRYLGFDDGSVLLIKNFSAEPSLTLECASVQLAKNMIHSATVGDNFWLLALRDRRIKMTGDMGLLLWFFGLCRHLKLRRMVRR